jgi:hypothetical protein
VSWSEFGIRCQNCIVYSEFVNRCWNWVGCSELAFIAELYVLQRSWDLLSKFYCLQQIWNSLPKLSGLQWINIQCRIVCFAANLGFATKIIEIELVTACVFCSEFRIWCQNWVVCSDLTFVAKLCVLQRIWDSLPKLDCLQGICNSLLKFSCLQRINVRYRIVCSAMNLGFAAEIQNWVVCS